MRFFLLEIVVRTLQDSSRLCIADSAHDWYTETSFGQVAQLVERSPEKAGVGGSIPSLATTFQSTYNLPFPIWLRLVAAIATT
jgi:hypothetical protein